MKQEIKTLLEARYEARDNLWLQKGEAQEFAYSDGDETENRIHSIVTRADDVSLFSPELKSAQTDWASRYHLSATRANLLRPLSDILSGSVLEIGSGCGAISRFLGELGGDVLGVEGSPRRAAIAAARCRDLPNVNIVNEVFDDFPPNARFDAVTLIGVLEYASIFGKTEDAAMTWLRKAYDSLEDGGHLVIAIENQLGLKYLAGMPEDHLAKAMFGINDLYSKGTATTYGRVELSGMLREAGFGSVEVALPFPDYKLPTSVVMPRGYDGSFPEFDASAFARQSASADAQIIHAPLFALGQAWGVVGRNDLLPDLANSFLFVARKGASPAAWATSGPLTQHFATERLSVYCKQVSFSAAGDAIEVRKALLAPDLHAQEMRPITLELHDESYIPGTNHGDRFERIVSAPGWEVSDVVNWFGDWQRALDVELESRGVKGSRTMQELLPDWAIDALPRNLMRSHSGEWHFIDLEWGWRAGVEYGYLAYRAITVALASLTAIAKPANERHVFIRYVMEDVLRECGLFVAPADLDRYVELDGVFRKLAYGVSHDFSAKEFATFQVRVLPDITSLVIDGANGARDIANRLQSMTDDRASFEAEYARRIAEHEQVALELAVARRDLSTARQQLKAIRIDYSRARSREEDLAREVFQKNRDIESLGEANSSFEQRLAVLARAEEESAIAQARLVSLEEKLSLLLNSRSWRLMAPLRVARRELNPRAMRQRSGRILQAGFRALPLGTASKARLKDAAFRVLSPVLGSTASYKAWIRTKDQAMERPSGPIVAPTPIPSLPIESVDGPPDQFVAIATNPLRSWEVDVRLIAFYLPQFHPIAENDEWWGRGFTEWTNVSKAEPQFTGHHQPQLPGELGFYDLRLIEVMARQAELARLYGVAGFCFHYYWFGGRRLLERPVEQFLASDIDFPFCICWANENWTRRWDGMDGEVLIGQSHSAEDDIAFIETLAPLLRDDRYIRVDGRPLVIVYRPSILPDAAATLERWRDYCRQSGIGEIFLGMVQFDVLDPRVYGFDAAIEFPPHKLARNLEAINDRVENLRPDFSGMIIDYDAIVERAKDVEPEGFGLFRGVFPSWDNEARKPGRGYLFHGATPEKYGRWLKNSLDYAREHPVVGEKLVFVNAWNEWAEGAHLEPDRRYGYAFLQATRDSLVEGREQRIGARRVVLVVHDAYAHGAQYLALHMARELREVFSFEVEIVILGEGPLIPKFREYGNVHVLAGVAQDGEEARRLASLLASSAQHAIVNSTAAGIFGRTLSDAGVEIVSLVHELPGVIRHYSLERHAAAIADVSKRIFFPASVVRDGFAVFAGLDEEIAELRPQGLFTRNRWRGTHDHTLPRASLRSRLGIPLDSQIALAVGYADKRKGVDLFVEAGIMLLKTSSDTHFIWVGHADDDVVAPLKSQIDDAGLSHLFHFVGMDFDTEDYYAAADIYVLASREDPFPSVVLEALSVGLPVIAFAESGGAADILRRDCGVLVESIDVHALALAMGATLADPGLRERLGNTGMELVATEFSFRRYVFALLDAVGLPQPRITAIVPNYNYGRLLPERLRSIDRQTLPVYELIVLDDGSTDDSLTVLESMHGELRTQFSIVVNPVNGGSVFAQWKLGVERAHGDLIWIAEADDTCESRFLERVSASFAESDVVLSYCQSRQVDGDGIIIANDYLAYTDDVDGLLWKADYVRDGMEEIHHSLAIKNTIPNVSAVVFLSGALRSVLDSGIEEISTFRIAGDWLTYMGVASQGRVAFTSEALNRHRRHGSSVTLGSSYLPHLFEVLRAQQIASTRYGAPPTQITRAWRYSSGLYQQFGLATVDAPTLDDLADAARFRP